MSLSDLGVELENLNCTVKRWWSAHHTTAASLALTFNESMAGMYRASADMKLIYR